MKDYGAVGDGIAVDTPAFIAASTAASVTPGSTILAPIGCYLIGSFNITGTNITLQVDGAILGSTRNIDYANSSTTAAAPCATNGSKGRVATTWTRKGTRATTANGHPNSKPALVAHTMAPVCAPPPRNHHP